MLSDTLIAALAGLASSFAWGVGDFFAARASKDTSPATSLLIVETLGAIIFTVVFALFMRHDFHIYASGLLYSFGAGMFMTLAAIFFYKGLEAGPVSLVSPIGAAYPLVTTLIAIGIFGDKLSAQQLAGIGLIIIGVLAASDAFTAKTASKKTGRGIKLAIATFILWGIAYAFLSPAVKSLGWQTASLVQLLVMAATYAAIFPYAKGSAHITLKDFRPSRNIFAIMNALIAVFGVVIFNVGAAHATSGAIVTAISASYPAITIFLSLKTFKEKVHPIPLTGGFISILGVVLLSM